MIRKQGNTARESNTSSSPLSPPTDSNPTRPSNNESTRSCFETLPAMTRQTNMALLPRPPPALSWATPLPENVQMAEPLAPGKAHAPPPRASYVPFPDVGPMQWNLITSFPSATHRAFSSHVDPSVSPPDPARHLTISRYSSNRVTVLDPFWTLNIISIRPVNAFGLQLVWKIISTTLREGWPSGSSDSAGKNGSGARVERFVGTETGSDLTGRGHLEPGSGLGDVDLDFLGLWLVASTTSLMLWELFLQLELGKRFLGFRWYTSSKAFDLQCNDLTHPLAIQTGYVSLKRFSLSVLSKRDSFWGCFCYVLLMLSCLCVFLFGVKNWEERNEKWRYMIWARWWY